MAKNKKSNLNDSITKSNPSALSWFKNVGKSLGYTSTELITSIMPTSMEFVTSNAETVQDIYNNMTDLRSQGSRLDSYVKQNTQLNLGRNMLKNAFEDIKSGNIYNKERQESLYAKDDEDFDFGDDDFSFGDDLGDDNFDSTETVVDKDSDGNVKNTTTINKTVNNVKNVRNSIPNNTNPQLLKALQGQSETIVNVAQGINETNIRTYNANAFVFEKFNSNLMGGLNAINENLGLLVNYQSDTMSKYIGGSLKFYEDNLNVLGETLTVLKEGFAINQQATQDDIKKGQANKVDSSDLFSGGINVKTYMDLVKSNASKTMANNPFLAPLKMMWEDTDTMEFMFASPLSFISNKIAKTLIPEFLTSAMEEFDKTFTSFFPALMMKINRLSFSDNPFMQILGDVFGFKTRRKTSADLSLYEKGKVPFDGITKKAITDVIPGYLRKILGVISGKEEVAYDFNKGQFDSMYNMSKRFNEDRDRTIVSSFRETTDAIMERAEAFKTDDPKFMDSFKKELNKFFIALSDKDKLVNPELRKDKDGSTIDELKEVYQFSNDAMQNLFRGIMDTLPKDMKLNTFGLNVMESRDKLTKMMEDIERDPNATNYNLIRNGLGFDHNLKRDPNTGKYTVKKGSGLGDVLDRFGKNSLDYLRDISMMLAKGIRVFGGGSSGDAENPNAGMLSGYTKAAKELSEKELDAQRKKFKPVSAAEVNKLNNSGVSYVDQYDLSDMSSTDIGNRVQTYLDIKKEEENGAPEKTIADSIRNVLFKDGKASDGFNKYSDMIKEIAAKPAKLLSNVMRKLDNTMYNIIFGNEDDTNQVSFFSKTFLMMQENLSKFGSWMKTKFFDPIKDALFGDEGFFTKIKKSDMYNQMTGKIKGFFKTSFGTDGWFSGIGDEFRDMFNGIGYYFSGKSYTDSKGKEYPDNPNSIIGNMKDTFADIGSSVKGYLFGKGERGDGKGLFGNLFDGMKEGFQNFNNALFGPKGFNGGGFDFSDTIGELTDKVKGAFPKAAAWGLMGAGTGLLAAGSGGLGLLGSLFLPGGPIGFGILGMAGGFLSQSDKFKNWLFGEKDASGERLGGVISKSTSDFFSKNKGAILGGAALGAIKPILGFGLLPSFFLPGGIVGGALTGIASSMLYRSNAVQNMLFGEENPDGTRIGGLFNKLYQGTSQYKSIIGNIGVGALGGAGLSLVVGKMGILGAMLTPGGILGGAILGAATGIALSSEKWKTALFGDFDEKTAKRKGGMLGKFTNWFDMEVKEPILIKFSEINLNMQEWFTKSVANPFREALQPIKTEFRYLTDQMVNMFYKSWDSFKGFLGNTFENFVGKPFGEFMEQNILNPLKKFFSGILNIGGKLVGSVVKAPFSLLQSYSNHLVEKQEKRGLRYEREAASNRFKSGEDEEGNKSSRVKSAMDIMGLYFSKNKRESAMHGEHGAEYYNDWSEENKQRRQEQDDHFNSKRDAINERKGRLDLARDRAKKADYENFVKDTDEEGNTKLDENGNPIYTDKYIGNIYDVWGKKRQRELQRRQKQEAENDAPEVQIDTRTKAQKKADKKKNQKLNNPADTTEAVVTQSTRIYEAVNDTNNINKDIVTAVNESSVANVEVSDDVLSALEISVEQTDETNSILSKILTTISGGEGDSSAISFFGRKRNKESDSVEVSPELEVAADVLQKQNEVFSNTIFEVIKTKEATKEPKIEPVIQKVTEVNSSKEEKSNVISSGNFKSKSYIEYDEDYSGEGGSVIHSILKHVIGIHRAVEGQLDGVGSNVYKMRRMMGKILNMDDDIEGSANRDRGGFFGRLTSFITRPFLAIKEVMFKPFQMLGDMMSSIKETASSAIGAVLSIPGKIFGVAKNIVSGLGDILGSVGSVLKEGAIELVKIPGKILGVMGDIASSALNVFNEAIVPAAGALLHGFAGMIGKTMTGIGSVIGGIGRGIGKTFEVIGETTVKFAGKIGEFALNTMTGIGTLISNTVSGISNILSSTISGFAKIASSTISGIADFTASTLKFAVNAVKDTASAVFKIISSPIKFFSKLFGGDKSLSKQDVYVTGGTLDIVRTVEDFGSNKGEEDNKSILTRDDYENLNNSLLGKLDTMGVNINSDSPVRVMIVGSEKAIDVNSKDSKEAPTTPDKGASGAMSRVSGSTRNSFGGVNADAVKSGMSNVIDFAKAKLNKQATPEAAKPVVDTPKAPIAPVAVQAPKLLPAPQADSSSSVSPTDVASLATGKVGKLATIGKLLSTGAKAIADKSKEGFTSLFDKKNRADKQNALNDQIAKNKEHVSRKTSDFIIAQNDEARAKEADINWKGSLLSSVLGIEANTRASEEGFRKTFGLKGLLTAAILGILPLLTDILKNLFGKSGDRTDPWGNNIANTDLGGAISSAIRQGFESLMKKFDLNYGSILRPIASSIKNGFESIVKKISGVFGGEGAEKGASKLAGLLGGEVGEEVVEKAGKKSANEILEEFVESKLKHMKVPKLSAKTNSGTNIAGLLTDGASSKTGKTAFESYAESVAKKFGTNSSDVIEDVAFSVTDDGAEAVAKGQKGLLNKGIQLIQQGMKAFGDTIAQKFPSATRIVSGLTGKLTSAITKSPLAVKKLTSKVGKQIVEDFGTVVVAGYQFFNGLANPERLFKVKASEADMLMRQISAIIRAALEIPFAWIVEIVNELSIMLFGYDFIQKVATEIYGAIGGEEAKNKLLGSQKAMQLELDKYNKTFGSNLSLDAYNDKVNRTLWQKYISDPLLGRDTESVNIDENGVLTSTRTEGRTGWDRFKQLFTGKENTTHVKDSNGKDLTYNTDEGNILQRLGRTIFGGKVKGTVTDNTTGVTTQFEDATKNIFSRVIDTVYDTYFDDGSGRNVWQRMSDWLGFNNPETDNIFVRIGHWLGFGNDPDKGQISIWGKISDWLGFGDGTTDKGDTIWTRMAKWLGFGNDKEAGEISIWNRISNWLGFTNNPDEGEISIWGHLSNWLGFSNIEADNIWLRIGKWLGFGNDEEAGEISIWNRIAGWLGLKGEETVSIWDKLQGWLGLRDVENTMSIWDRMYSWMGFDDENSFMYKLSNSKAADFFKDIFGIGTDSEGNERTNIVTRTWNKLTGKDKKQQEQVDTAGVTKTLMNPEVAAYQYLIKQMNPDLDISQLSEMEITPEIKEQMDKVLSSQGISLNDTITGIMGSDSAMSQMAEMLGFISNMDEFDTSMGKKSWWQKTKEFFSKDKNKSEDGSTTEVTDESTDKRSIWSKMGDGIKNGTSWFLDLMDGGYGTIGKWLGFSNDPEQKSIWDWISMKLGFGDGTEEGGMNIFDRIGKWLGFDDTQEEVSIWERFSYWLGFGDGTEDGGETLWTKINRKIFGGRDEEGNYKQSIFEKIRINIFGAEADEEGKLPPLFENFKKKVFGYVDEDGNYNQSMWDKFKISVFGMEADETGRVSSLWTNIKQRVMGYEDEDGTYHQSLWEKMKVSVFGMEEDETGRVGSLWVRFKTGLFGEEPEDGIDRESLWARFKRNTLGSEEDENGDVESIWKTIKRKTGLYEEDETTGEYRSLWESLKIRTFGSEINQDGEVDSIWTTFKKKIFGAETDENGEVDSLWVSIKKKTGLYKEDEDGNEITMKDKIMSALGLDLQPNKDMKTLPQIIEEYKNHYFGAYTDEGVMKNFNLKEGSEENITTSMRVISKIAEVGSVFTNGKLSPEDIAHTLNGMFLSVVELKDLAKEKIIDTFETVKTNVTEAVQPIIDSAKEKWEEIKTNISTGWDNVKTKVDEAISPVIESAKEKWEEIKTNISTGWDNVKTKVDETLAPVIETAKEKWEELKSNISTGWDNVKSKVNENMENAKTDASEKWETIKSNISAGWEGIKSKIDEKSSPIIEAASNKWEEIKTSTEKIWTGIKDKMVGLKDDFIKNLGKTWDKMMEPVTSVIDWVKDKFTFFKNKSKEETGSGQGAGNGAGYGEFKAAGMGGEKYEGPKVTMKARPIEPETNRRPNALECASCPDSFPAGGAYNGSTSSQNMPDKIHSFAYYSQADKRWGNHKYDYSSGLGHSSTPTIAARGCGPTSLSMVLTNLTGKRYYPNQIADYSRNSGYSVNGGTSWGLFTKAANDWDMSVETTGRSKDAIRARLKEGKPVVLSGQRSSSSSKSASPFTTGGHLVTAVGTDGNNNILINDPRGPEESKSYSLDTVVSQMAQGWAYKYKDSGKTLPDASGSFSSDGTTTTENNNNTNGTTDGTNGATTTGTTAKDFTVIDGINELTKNMGLYVKNIIMGESNELDLSSYYATESTAPTTDTSGATTGDGSNANGTFDSKGQTYYVNGIELGTKQLAGVYNGTYNSVFNSAGAKYGVEPALLKAISMQESGGNVNSNNGYALGLMQIEKTLASEFANFGKQYEGKSYSLADRADPNKAVPFGASRFASDLSHYGGDFLKAIQAYNFSKYSLDILIKKYPNDWMKYRNIMGSLNGTGMSSYGDKQYIEHVLRYYHGDIIKQKGAGNGEVDDFKPVEPIKTLKDMKGEGRKVNMVPTPDASMANKAPYNHLNGNRTPDEMPAGEGEAKPMVTIKSREIEEPKITSNIPAGMGEAPTSTSISSNRFIDSMEKATSEMSNVVKEIPTLERKFSDSSSTVNSYIKTDTSSSVNETTQLLSKAITLLASIDSSAKITSSSITKFSDKEISINVNTNGSGTTTETSKVSLNNSTPVDITVNGGSTGDTNMMNMGSNGTNRNYSIAKQIARGK